MIVANAVTSVVYIISRSNLPVVPPGTNRQKPWRYDKKRYKRRHEVERFFRRLKDFCRIFTRYGKLAPPFSFFLQLVVIYEFSRNVA